MESTKQSHQQAQPQTVEESTGEGTFMTPPAFHLTADDGPGDGTIQKQEVSPGDATQPVLLSSRIRELIRNNAGITAIQSEIQSSPVSQRTAARDDQSLRQALSGAMTYNPFSRCMELLGLLAPNRGDIVHNSELRGAFQRAWEDSHPAFRDTPATIEQGGWIYFDLVRNHAFTIRSQDTGLARVSLANTPVRANCTVVGIFHTHPSSEQSDGRHWETEPSDVDVHSADWRGVPSFVLAWGPQSPGTYTIHHTGVDRRPNLTNSTYPPASGPAPEVLDPWAGD